MKYYLLVLGLVLNSAVFAATREIVMETQKVDDAVHWRPEKVEVTPGETVKFVVKHDLEGGFDFHGFFVPQLKIQKQVNRHKAEEVTVKIPKHMKEGEYPMGCHYHPKHVAATLIVKSKTTKN